MGASFELKESRCICTHTHMCIWVNRYKLISQVVKDARSLIIYFPFD